MAPQSNLGGFRRFTGRPIAPLALLLFLSLIPRMIAAAMAVAPARDAARYWSAAQRFGSDPWRQSLREAPTLPMYPMALAGLHQAWVLAGGVDGPWTWFRISQGWGIFCSLVFLGVSFQVGKRIARPEVAWWGVLAVAWLPRQVGYASDVLNDCMFAAMWMISFLCLVLAWQKNRIHWFGAAGLVAGLAMLTRAEGLALPATFLLALVFFQFFNGLGLSLGEFTIRAAVYAAPLALLLGMYVGVTGRYSPSNSARALLGQTTKPESLMAVNSVLDEVDSSTWLAERFRGDGLLGAAMRLVAEIAQETRGILLALAIFAVPFLWRRQKLGEGNLGRLLAVVSLLVVGGMLIALRMRAGFLSSRYLTPILPFIGMAAIVGAEQCLVFLERIANRSTTGTARAWPIGAAFVFVFVALCAPTWFRPMHRHRESHMAAAGWLASHSAIGDSAIDASWLVSFFADRPRWQPPSPPPRWIVLDPSQWSKADALTQRGVEMAAAAGSTKVEFAKHAGRPEIGVVIYEIPLSLSSRWSEALK